MHVCAAHFPVMAVVQARVSHVPKLALTYVMRWLTRKKRTGLGAPVVPLQPMRRRYGTDTLV